MEQVLAGKRIVIVEDDVANMAVFTVTLKRSGARIIQDPWNTGTLELIRENLPVDLIILDLMLRRGASGYDIFDLLKAAPDLAAIPVVVISASEPQIEIPKAKEKGFAGYICKPIEQMNLAQQLADVLDGKSVWISESWRKGVNKIIV
jgi:two-component system, chemotaxis family, sensor kinase CheA